MAAIVNKRVSVIVDGERLANVVHADIDRDKLTVYTYAREESGRVIKKDGGLVEVEKTYKLHRHEVEIKIETE